MCINKKSNPFRIALAVWTGLEPATPCVTGMYSNQLNYQTKMLFFIAIPLNCGAKIGGFFELAIV